MESISVRKNSVVDTKILENFDNSKRSARQDALLSTGRVKKSDVLIHIKNVLVGKTFDIFIDGDDLLQILVLAVTENWIVDDDAVDSGVIVGVDQSVFQKLTVDLTELEIEATVDVL